MFYFEETGGFYDPDVHLIPSGAVEITKEQHSNLLLEQSRGKEISVGSDGMPVAIDRPFAPVAELLELAKSELRTLRRDMLDAVTGIGFRANVLGNTVLAQEATQVSQQLLDITDDPALNAAQTYDEMRASGMAAYHRIADSVSPGLRSAFKNLEK